MKSVNPDIMRKQKLPFRRPARLWTVQYQPNAILPSMTCLTILLRRILCILDLVMTTQFRKDLKRINKRGKDLSLLKDVLQTLREEQALEEKYRDHALTGNYIGFRECHIQPDWLLVYAINKEELILTASRTGSHSDLF